MILSESDSEWGAMVCCGWVWGDPRGQLTPDEKKRKKIKIYNFDIFASESKLGGYGRLKMGWGWTKGGIWPPMKKKKTIKFYYFDIFRVRVRLGGPWLAEGSMGVTQGGQLTSRWKKSNFPNLIFSSTSVKSSVLFQNPSTLWSGCPRGEVHRHIRNFGHIGFMVSMQMSWRVLHAAPIADDVTSGLMTSPWKNRKFRRRHRFMRITWERSWRGEFSHTILSDAPPVQTSYFPFCDFFLWTARMALNAGDDGRQCPGHTALEPSAKLRNSLEHLSRAWERLLIFFGPVDFHGFC